MFTFIIQGDQKSLIRPQSCVPTLSQSLSYVRMNKGDIDFILHRECHFDDAALDESIMG